MQPELGYSTVPLAKQEIKVAAMQMATERVKVANPAPGIQRNLRTLLRMCDTARGHDLLVFPEFALTRGEAGCCRNWTREQWLRVAIKVPGPETEAIGKKAKELGCYIEFASYTQQPDWPGHFFNASIIIAPTGEIIHNHWKAYFGYPGIGIEYATTVFDVLSEFVRRYGWDAVWPVSRTPIGNLATYICSEGMLQEAARCLAINGAEILCRSFGGGGPGNRGGKFLTEFRGDCAYNDCWGIYANNGTHESLNPVQVAMAGGSMIVNPLGQVVAQADSVGEEIVSATIPIGQSRTSAYSFGHMPGNPHMTPTKYRGGLRTELYIPLFMQNQGQFPPDLLTAYQRHNKGALPPDYDAARKWYLEHARWELEYVDKPKTIVD
ncbi:MAG: nitrilase-related carbon-nitrogen hydrolase [Chloroflexota bacterium]